MTLGAVSETIILRGVEVELSSAAGQEFLLGATRAAEGLVDDSELAEKWELSLEDLKTLANNKAVGRAIKELRARRVNSGAAARESAAQIFVRAPKTMGEILNSSQTPPRVKIEASRELRATATGTGDDNRSTETERFVIRIDLTAAADGEVLEFDKAIKIGADDLAPDEQPKLPTRPKLTVLSNDGLENDE
jgi:hypothetical protein